MGMALKLHRCATPWKLGPCWRVQKELDNRGIAYEVVPGPWRPKDRAAVLAGTGQPLSPAIQFEDGSIKSQMGLPDMKLPNQYALSFPRRIPSQFPRYDFKKPNTLTFEEPDVKATIIDTLLQVYVYFAPVRVLGGRVLTINHG